MGVLGLTKTSSMREPPSHDHSKQQNIQSSMRGSRKFCQRGSYFDKVFLVDEGREDPNTTISGSLSAFRWRADDGPPLNAGVKKAL